MKKRPHLKLDLSDNHMVRIPPEAYELLREMKRSEKKSMADLTSEAIISFYLNQRTEKVVDKRKQFLYN